MHIDVTMQIGVIGEMGMKISDDDLYAYIDAIKKDIKFLSDKIDNLPKPKDYKFDSSNLWFAILCIFLVVMKK